MYEDLVRQLRACADNNVPCETADCGYKPFENQDCIEQLELRAADAIEALLKAARAMHLWIFNHSVDEQEAYDECGLSDEMNAELGYGGKLVIEIPKEET